MDFKAQNFAFIGSINLFFSSMLSARLRARGCRVHAFSLRQPQHLGLIQKNFDSVEALIPPCGSRWVSYLVGLMRLVRLVYRVGLTRQFDIVHLHYATNTLVLFLLLLTPRRKRFVLTFYGSDIYQSPAWRLNWVRLFRGKVWGINCENIQTLNKIKDHMGADVGIDYQICRFGNENLDYMRPKALNDFFQGKTIRIAIGSNAHPRQQHLKVLKALGKLRPSIRERVVVQMQLTYGAPSGGYVQSLQNELAAQGWKSEQLVGLQSAEQIAEFRARTDIFINVQPTDQFSSSLQENMYLRNFCIVGSWLPYKTFKDKGLCFFEVDRISDLAEMVHRVVDQSDVALSKMSAHPDLIHQLNSWSACEGSWLQQYMKHS